MSICCKLFHVVIGRRSDSNGESLTGYAGYLWLPAGSGGDLAAAACLTNLLRSYRLRLWLGGDSCGLGSGSEAGRTHRKGLRPPSCHTYMPWLTSSRPLLSVQCHAIGVCDTPDEFYDIIEQLASELGVDASESGPFGGVRSWISIYSGVGGGYAVTSPQELQFLYDVSSATGVLFDQVYAGKALYNFQTIAASRPDIFQPGQNVLFIHTGGVFGLYACAEELLQVLPEDQAQALTL